MAQEYMILTGLKFDINVPTILFFLNRFVKVAGFTKR